MQSNDATYDRRAFPICRPYDCSRGAEYRRFSREFLAGAQSIDVDDNYSLDEVVLGLHQGGDDPSAQASSGNNLCGAAIRRDA